MAHLREEADKLEAKGLNLERAFASGEPGTTGREPFEDSTASGPGSRFASGNVGESEHHHHQHQHHQHGEHAGAGATGLGAGGLGGAGAGAGGLSSGNQGLDRDARRQDSGAGDYKTFEQTGQQKMDAAASGGYTGSATGNPEAGEGKRHEKDLVGDLQQDSHLYERSGQSGPATHGAAGTDRFDTHSTGVHQGDANPGARREEGEVDRRGEGKGTGGVLGVLGTTDKEFTARDRLGKGAYHDDDAHFKANTSGPGGNTALTGREGNQENNPVAQAKSRQGEDVNDVHQTSGERVGHADHPEHQKKGIVEKIKEKISS